MSDLLQRAAEGIQERMDEILANFKPGAKITVLVRTPDKPTSDFCMTDDNLWEVTAMLQRRMVDAGYPVISSEPLAFISQKAFGQLIADHSGEYLMMVPRDEPGPMEVALFTWPTPVPEANPPAPDMLAAGSEVHPYAPERQSRGGQPDHNDSQQPRPTNWALASTVSERSELEHKGSWNQSDSQSDPERHDQQIVEVAKNGNEVRDQVDRREGVGGHAACNDLRHDGRSFVTGSEPEGYHIAFQRTCPVLQTVQPSIHDLAYTRGDKSGPASHDSLYTPAPASEEVMP